MRCMMIIPLFMWIGIWQRLTVNGVEPACPPNLNGKKLREGDLDLLIHGAEILTAIKQITLHVKQIRLRLAVMKAEGAHMDYMIWRETFLNGL